MSLTPEQYSRFGRIIFSHAMMSSSMSIIEQETGLSSADIIGIIKNDLLKSANETQQGKLRDLLPPEEVVLPKFEYREGESSSQAIDRLVEFARSIVNLPWLSGGSEMSPGDKEVRIPLFRSRFNSYVAMLDKQDDLSFLGSELTALSGKSSLVAPPAILGVFPSAHGLRDAFFQIAQRAVQERMHTVRETRVRMDSLQSAETRAISLDDIRRTVGSPRSMEPARPPSTHVQKSVPEYTPPAPVVQSEQKGGLFLGLFGGKRRAEEEARMRQEQEAQYREALGRRDEHLHNFLSSRVFGGIPDIRQKLESIGYRVTGLPQRGGLPPLVHEYQTNVTLRQEGRQYSVKLKLMLGGNKEDWTVIYSVDFGY